VLRYKMPGLPRPFRCPAIRIVAPLAVIMCLVLMLMLPWETWLRFILWFCFGLIIYFGYGYSHSHLSKEKALEMVGKK